MIIFERKGAYYWPNYYNFLFHKLDVELFFTEQLLSKKWYFRRKIIFGVDITVRFKFLNKFSWHYIHLTWHFPDTTLPWHSFSWQFYFRHIFSDINVVFLTLNFTEIISVYFTVYWWSGYNYSMCQCGPILNFLIIMYICIVIQ